MRMPTMPAKTPAMSVSITLYCHHRQYVQSLIPQPVSYRLLSGLTESCICCRESVARRTISLYSGVSSKSKCGPFEIWSRREGINMSSICIILYIYLCYNLHFGIVISSYVHSMSTPIEKLTALHSALYINAVRQLPVTKR